MRLTGLRSSNGRVLLAPVFAIAGWTIVLGVVVEAGIPITDVRTALWLASAPAAIWGAWLAIRDLRAYWWHFAISAATTAALLNGYFIYGLTTFAGSPALDGWSYISFGQYLYEYPKGAEGSLAPLYQYAAHLSEARFAGPALLAALQPPLCTSCDTQSAAGPLLAISVFAFAASCAYLAHLAIRSPPVELFYVVTCILGGWLHGAVRINNFDNILVLPVAPALVALTLFKNSDGLCICAHALLLASAAYIYPEMLPLTLVLYALVLANSAFHTSHYTTYAHFAGKVAVVSLVLTLPFASLNAFFWGQLSQAMVSIGPRPGEGIFPSLLHLRRPITEFWGLNSTLLSFAIGVVFFVLLLVGSARLLRQQFAALAVFVGLIALMFGLMVFRYQYDYGAFKTLLYGWWAIALVLAVGLKEAWRIRLGDLFHPKVASAWFLIFIVGTPSVYAWLKNASGWYENIEVKSIQPFRELYQLARVTNGAPIKVNIPDHFKNAWAVYFLRGMPAQFVAFRGYMTLEHVVPYMKRSWQPTETAYLLVERGQPVVGEIVWENSQFALWHTPGQP
jgi:hypothetical protein